MKTQLQIPDGTPSVVSHSFTRHAVAAPGGWQSNHAGRIATMCDMGFKPEAGPYEHTQDCQFCAAAIKHADKIREMSPPIAVTEAADELGVSVEEIHLAVGGSPYLSWSGISHTRIAVVTGPPKKTA